MLRSAAPIRWNPQRRPVLHFYAVFEKWSQRQPDVHCYFPASKYGIEQGKKSGLHHAEWMWRLPVTYRLHAFLSEWSEPLVHFLKSNKIHIAYRQKTAITDRFSSRTHVRLGAWFWSAQADIFFSESLHSTLRSGRRLNSHWEILVTTHHLQKWESQLRLRWK